MNDQHLDDVFIQQLAFTPDECPDAVVQHVEHCLHCQQQVQSYRAVGQLGQALEKPLFDFDVAALVTAQLPNTKPAPRNEGWTLLAIFLSVTAAVFIAIYFGRSLFGLFSSNSPIVTGLIVLTAAGAFGFAWNDLYRRYQTMMKILNQ